MSEDWRSLADGEEVLWEGNPRIMTVLPAAVVGLLVVVAPIVAAVQIGQPLVGLLALLGPVIPVWSYLGVTNTEFVVTNLALYRKTGVLSRTIQRVSLSNVQNSNFSQGIRGSLFGYGAVEIEAAGGGSIRFHDIESPKEVRRLVDNQIGESDSIPGSIEQWREILAEVRALRRGFEEQSY